MSECCLVKRHQCCCVCRQRVLLKEQDPNPPRGIKDIGWACLLPKEMGEDWILKHDEHGSCEMWWGVEVWQEKVKEALDGEATT